MSSEAQAAYYGVLNEEETEISLTLDLTDESGEHVVAVSTEPYSAKMTMMTTLPSISRLGLVGSRFLQHGMTEADSLRRRTRRAM
jgi:hypothetical protein